jgi:hypothetical protein
MFPNPIALPARAIMTAKRLEKFPLLGDISG